MISEFSNSFYTIYKRLGKKIHMSKINTFLLSVILLSSFTIIISKDFNQATTIFLL